MVYGSAIHEDGLDWVAWMPAKATTGAVEPEPGNKLKIDGNIKYYYESNYLPLGGSGTWTANTAINNSTSVIANGYFWTTSYTGNTGSTVPDWNSDTWIQDGDVYWSRRGQTFTWSANTTYNLTHFSDPPVMVLPSQSKVVEFMPVALGPIQSGATKPDFSSGDQVIDNEIVWQSVYGGDSAFTMPYLKGLDGSNAENGRLVTIHFTGNIMGAGSGSGLSLGSGASGLTIPGTASPVVTIGLPAYAQTMPNNAIEGTQVSSTGSVTLMWDATIGIWRIVSGGNERAIPIPEWW